MMPHTGKTKIPQRNEKPQENSGRRSQENPE
jgi:hypothetical protein